MHDGAPPKVESSAEEASLTFTVFQTLIALAMLFHHFSSVAVTKGLEFGGELALSLTAITTVSLALIQLLLPRSKTVWNLLLLSDLIDTACWLPHLPNHKLMLSATSVYLLVEGLRGPNPLSRSMPALRISAVILYSFAAIHKLNGDFFMPERSCASLFYRHVLEILPIAPTAIAETALFPGLVIFAELLLVLSLARPSLHRYGVALGLLFHFGLALDTVKQFFNFSAVMHALLFTFVPEGAFRGSPLGRLISRGGDRGLRTLLVFLLTSILLAQLFVFKSEPLARYFVASRFILWWSIAIGVMANFMYCFRAWRVEIRPAPTKLGAVFCVMLILIGFGPYIGFRTRGAFDMYSNLRVEGETSNHYLFPGSLDLLGYLHDVVQIVESSDPLLEREYREPNLGIVWFELNSRFHKAPEWRTRYIRHGREYIREPGAAFESPKESMLRRKLLWFRPVDLNSTVRCLW